MLSQSVFTQRRSGNRLLDALSSHDLVDIELDLEFKSMKAHESSQQIAETMRHVDFPLDAVLSVIATLDGISIEVGTIGNEGFVEGGAALLETVASRSAICQVGGTVARMPIEAFRRRMTSRDFDTRIRKNVAATLFSTQQFIVCNSVHSDVSRCARWLLMTADRAGRPEFVLSSDFLRIMLGISADAMKNAVRFLHEVGAMAYSGATVEIHDLGLLESYSCACYAACKAAFATSLLD